MLGHFAFAFARGARRVVQTFLQVPGCPASRHSRMASAPASPRRPVPVPRRVGRGPSSWRRLLHHQRARPRRGWSRPCGPCSSARHRRQGIRRRTTASDSTLAPSPDRRSLLARARGTRRGQLIRLLDADHLGTLQLRGRGLDLRSHRHHVHRTRRHIASRPVAAPADAPASAESPARPGLAGAAAGASAVAAGFTGASNGALAAPGPLPLPARRRRGCRRRRCRRRCRRGFEGGRRRDRRSELGTTSGAAGAAVSTSAAGRCWGRRRFRGLLGDFRHGGDVATIFSSTALRGAADPPGLPRPPLAPLSRSRLAFRRAVQQPQWLFPGTASCGVSFRPAAAPFLWLRFRGDLLDLGHVHVFGDFTAVFMVPAANHSRNRRLQPRRSTGLIWVQGLGWPCLSLSPGERNPLVHAVSGRCPCCRCQGFWRFDDFR